MFLRQNVKEINKENILADLVSRRVNSVNKQNSSNCGKL